MNLQASFKGFKRTNWENKSSSQKQKALIGQYEKLGLKVPKYLQKNTLSNTNFNSAINRISKTYAKRIDQSQPKVKLSDLQYEAMKVNSQIDKITKQLKKQGYSDKTLDFLQGERIYLEITDRAIMKNGALLKKISLDNYYGTQQGMKTYLKQIKKQRLKLKQINFKNDTNEKIKNVTRLSELIDTEEYFEDIDGPTLTHLLNTFNSLNNVQQEVSLNSVLAEFREKYKGEQLEGDYMYNAVSKLIRNLNYIKENV